MNWYISSSGRTHDAVVLRMTFSKKCRIKLLEQAQYIFKWSSFFGSNPYAEGGLKVIDFNSVFQTEIFGIIESAKGASAPISKSINFLVDGQAAIKALRKAKSHCFTADWLGRSGAPGNISCPWPSISFNGYLKQWILEDQLRSWNTTNKGYMTNLFWDSLVLDRPKSLYSEARGNLVILKESSQGTHG